LLEWALETDAADYPLIGYALGYFYARTGEEGRHVSSTGKHLNCCPTDVSRTG